MAISACVQIVFAVVVFIICDKKGDARHGDKKH